MTEIHYEIVIEASPETVYAHLTERAGLLRWMGVAATSDPVPGGELTWTHRNGATMIGRFVHLDPPRRVVFSYGWKDDLMGVPPESTTVEIQLAPTAGATQLRLTHRLLPPDWADQHRHGWAHFLSQLEQLLDVSSVDG